MAQNGLFILSLFIFFLCVFYICFLEIFFIYLQKTNESVVTQIRRFLPQGEELLR